jgi:hypothetical protein
MTLTAIKRSSRWLAPCGMLAALVLLVSNGFGVVRSRAVASHSQPNFNTLVHWHDSTHDWLLVADDKADQLTVYDATDGRLLRRLGTGSGLGDVAALAQRDGQLYVVDDDGRLGQLRLPQLQLMASSSR